MANKVGRPKKLESEKIKYQLIAIREGDYLELKRKMGENPQEKEKIADIIGNFIRVYEPGDFKEE